jgi:hypothetical protein
MAEGPGVANMKHFFKFNTCRPYTDDGQIIRVVLADDQDTESGISCWFYDISRGIQGKISGVEYGFGKRQLMEAYDSGKYEGAGSQDLQMVWIQEHFGDVTPQTKD